jgi:hypothetical protein
MKEHQVTLRIRQDADTPQEAATEALNVILRSGSLTFEVECPDGGLYEVAVSVGLAELVAACRKARWETDATLEMFGEFIDRLGFDMSVPDAPGVTRHMNMPRDPWAGR